MKKILVILISALLLISCNTLVKEEQVVCKKAIEEPTKIDREITIFYKDNLITRVNSLDEYYFSEEFSKEMFKKLENDMQERHQESENVEFSFEENDESGKVSIKLKDINEAEPLELMLIGLSEDDEEFLPGLTETVRLNKKAGYTCDLEEN